MDQLIDEAVSKELGNSRGEQDVPESIRHGHGTGEDHARAAHATGGWHGWGGGI